MSDRFANIPWLLATGQGRSGTTVLTRALAEHPAVCSNAVESNVMKEVLLAGYHSSTMPSRVRQMVLPREEHDRVFRNMLVELLFPPTLWPEPADPQVLSTFSAMEPAAAGFAVEVLPGIHFANIVRNGIEVVASRMAHRVLGQHSFEQQCVAWAAGIEMVQWGENRQDFTLIRHEELLEEHACRQTTRRLLERAGLAACPAVADYFLNHQRNRTRCSGETEAEAADLSRRHRRWKAWTDSQRQTFERICRPAMEFFGYPIPW